MVTLFPPSSPLSPEGALVSKTLWHATFMTAERNPKGEPALSSRADISFQIPNSSTPTRLAVAGARERKSRSVPVEHKSIFNRHCSVMTLRSRSRVPSSAGLCLVYPKGGPHVLYRKEAAPIFQLPWNQRLSASVWLSEETGIRAQDWRGMLRTHHCLASLSSA